MKTEIKSGNSNTIITNIHSTKLTTNTWAIQAICCCYNVTSAPTGPPHFSFSFCTSALLLLTGPHVNKVTITIIIIIMTPGSSLPTQYATVSIYDRTVQIKMAPVAANHKMKLPELGQGHTNFHSSSSTDQRYTRSNSLWWHCMTTHKLHSNIHTCHTAAISNTPQSAPENQLHQKSIFVQK